MDMDSKVTNEDHSSNHISIRGWSIILTLFLADALSLGGRSLFLILLVVWRDDFGWETSSLSALMAVVHICNGLCTPVSGYLVDIFKMEYTLGFGLTFLAFCFMLTALITARWQLWLFYGVLSGSAYGILNLNVFSVAVIRSVPQNRCGFALGLTTSGSTFGQLVLVPAFAYISQVYGWRMAYAGLSVCAGSLVLPAVLLLRGGAQTQEREDKQIEDGDDSEMNSNQIKLNRLETSVVSVSVSECDEVEVEVEVEGFCSNQDDNDDDNFLLPFWHLAQYWCLTVVFVICGITTTGFIESHLVALAVHKGELLSIAALAFSVLSAVNGISMVLVGYLSDVCDRHKLLAAIFFVRSLAYLLLLIPTTNSRAVLFIFASVFGAVDYSVVPVVVSIVRSIAGDSAVGLAVGVLLLWHSLGAAAGASVGGVIFNATGSYTTAICICAGLCFCSSLICLSMGLSIFKPNNHRRYSGYLSETQTQKQRVAG